jgi:hypothetical protein
MAKRAVEEVAPKCAEFGAVVVFTVGCESILIAAETSDSKWKRTLGDGQKCYQNYPVTVRPPHIVVYQPIRHVKWIKFILPGCD